jgi:hypothetical protein
MELGDLASAPIVEMTLLLGGLLAMASAVVGHKEGNTMGNVLVWVGFIAGAFILIVGLVALTIRSGAWPASTIIILFVLGLGLFMHLIKKVKWAALIALIVGTGIGYGLYQLAKAINFTWLLDNTIVIVVIAFVSSSRTSYPSQEGYCRSVRSCSLPAFWRCWKVRCYC